jgi:hypothetical protein
MQPTRPCARAADNAVAAYAAEDSKRFARQQ